jgi:hypothetical protein
LPTLQIEEALVVAKIRSHFFHNFVGYVALGFALSGTAYAVNTVRSQDIVDSTIQPKDVSVGVLPRIYSASGPGDPVTVTPGAGERELVKIDKVDDGDFSYLVIATFEAATNRGYLCHLSASGSGDRGSNEYLNGARGGQTMMLVARPVPANEGKTFQAAVSCRDNDTSGDIQSFEGSEISVVRVSSRSDTLHKVSR